MTSKHHQSSLSAHKRRDILLPLPLLDEQAVLKRFFEKGISESHAYKIWRYIIQKKVDSIDQIPDLPSAVYDLVKREFSICTSTQLQRHDNKDGSTTKLVIRLQDGKLLECVIMRYGSVELSSFPKDRSKYSSSENCFKSNRRATLCVSSQIGCQMGCTFCATGTMGLQGNLLSGEILEQVLLASRIEKIRNVVFMGMGEPLDNYNEVLLAIRAMSDVKRFQLSSHHITISTVGVAPRIKQLAIDAPGVRLALSLHAPNQQLRAQMIPTSRTWPMEKILDATDFFVKQQKDLLRLNNNIIMFEYVLISKVNDSEKTAHELGNLLSVRSENVLLNIIPYNPTLSSIKYSPPFQEEIDFFISIIRTYGVKVTVRQELGQDIDSACGQLVISSEYFNKITFDTAQDKIYNKLLTPQCEDNSDNKSPSVIKQEPKNCELLSKLLKYLPSRIFHSIKIHHEPENIEKRTLFSLFTGIGSRYGIANAIKAMLLNFVTDKPHHSFSLFVSYKLISFSILIYIIYNRIKFIF